MIREQARLTLLWRFFVASALLVLLLVFRYFASDSGSEWRQYALAVFVTVEYVGVLLGLAIRSFWPVAVYWLLPFELFLDLLGLALLVYFSGGLFSEFLALYVFVAIASAGLLQPPIRYVLLTLSTLTLPVMAFVNWLGYGFELPLLASADFSLTLFARTLYYEGVIALGAGFAVFLSRYADRARSDLAATALGLQHQRRYNEQILAAIPSGLVLTNPDDNTILTANAAAVHILGDRANEVVAQMQVGPKPHSARGEIETAQGQILGYSITNVSLPNASTVKQANLLMFQDVTKYRRLEQQVEVQDKLAAIGRLGANLAHEIRNPLTSISNVIQLLRQKQPKDASTDSLLGLAGSEIQRLEKLLTEFLNFAKPGTSSEVTIEEIFAPRGEIESILAHIARPPHAHFSLAPSTSAVSQVRGHRGIFRQVAYNLILNASQWADPKSPTLVCTIEIQGNNLLLNIEDNGPGVPIADRSTIWEPFVSRRPQGTGLGLALVSTLTASVGGTIEYTDSAALGGAKFSFSMPCTPVPQ